MATAPAPGRPRSGRRPLLVLAVVVAALGFLAFKGLDEATTYYRNVDEAVADRDELGDRRFRLQGVVVPGSVVEDGTDVRFVLAWRCVELDVTHAGDRPDLFKPGLPVVVEGAFAAGTDEYRSDRIINKHTESYKDSAEERERQGELDACPS